MAGGSSDSPTGGTAAAGAKLDSNVRTSKARKPLTLPFTEDTYSVSRLCMEVRDLLSEAFGWLWVAGEVQRLRPSRRGHLYFELVEKGPRDEIVGKVEGVCWRRDYERIERALAASGQALAEGQEIRCRGNLDFYAPFGRLQLVVREVDPVFTLGQLAKRRRETLEWLAAAGLLEKNRELELPRLPLDLALVTSEGSAAFHDFVSTLRESPYGFRVLFLHAAVQGREAERELVDALARLSSLAVDCAVVVRGGGARTDLAVFDSRPVAAAVAQAPVPVLTGLGHEIDETIADRVAHTALKTPTKVAELLVDRVRRTDEAVEERAAALERQALEPLRRARRELERIESAAHAAGYRVAAASRRLTAAAAALGRSTAALLRLRRGYAAELGRALRRAAPRELARRSHEPQRLGERLAAAAGARLREVGARIDGLARLCQELGPERTLARGFTMTRSASGALLRSSRATGPGERMVTRWVDGERTSRVEEP